MSLSNFHLCQNDCLNGNVSSQGCSLSTDGFVTYVKCIYEDFGNNFTVLGLFIYLSLLMILFVIVGTTVDHFFCPSLEVISKCLGLSQNVAGVTFLAFGNGAPEIFSSIAGAKVERPELVISGLFGSAMFLTCVVAGSIIIMTSSFRMVERPFLRDVIFFLIVTFGCFVLLYYGKITHHYALGFLAAYLVYTILVLVIHHIHQKFFKHCRPRHPSSLINTSGVMTRRHPSTSSIVTLEGQVFSPIPSSQSFLEQQKMMREMDTSCSFEIDEVTPWGVPPFVKHWDSGEEYQITTDILDDFDDILDSVEMEPRSPSSIRPLTASGCSIKSHAERHESVSIILASIGTFRLFLYGIYPINYCKWLRTPCWKRTLQFLRAPAVFVLKLTIPLVDLKDYHCNWCRPLNSLHCLTSPMFSLMAIGYGFVDIYGGFQLWMLFAIAGSITGVLVFFTTVNDKAPDYHSLFAFLGFFTSLCWIYIVAVEIVHLLMTFGSVLHLSDTILGLTVLSWGNGIPDFIADLTIAKQGFPQMGISACFGGPLIIPELFLVILLGVGIPFTAVTLGRHDHTLQVIYTRSSTLFFVFIWASTLSSLVAFPLMNFSTHRFYGYYLLMLYIAFVILVSLNEFQII